MDGIEMIPYLPPVAHRPSRMARGELLDAGADRAGIRRESADELAEQHFATRERRQPIPPAGDRAARRVE
jgi:hypothetical protein